jgi:NADPH:quinone reductase
MKAVGFYKNYPITHPEALVDVEVPDPVCRDTDLLVEIKAAGLNPVDYKVRKIGEVPSEGPRILGWDASGIIRRVGTKAEGFEVGQEVLYSGAINRPGSNAQFQAVDFRLVGHKPKNLTFTQAAAIPLTAITAWEAFFDRLQIGRESPEKNQKLLLIGAAGGVGSLAIQLGRQIPNVRIVATASRPESRDWCLELGAHEVIDHPKASMKGSPWESSFHWILCLQDTDEYFASMAELIRPQGKICSIVETRKEVPLGLLKNKSASFHWELMFTRSMYQTADMAEQGRIVEEVVRLFASGELKSALSKTYHGLTAENFRNAHAELESGRTVGKIVVEF